MSAQVQLVSAEQCDTGDTHGVTTRVERGRNCIQRKQGGNSVHNKSSKIKPEINYKFNTNNTVKVHEHLMRQIRVTQKENSQKKQSRKHIKHNKLAQGFSRK